MRWSAVGLEIGLCMALGFFAGKWLDKRFATFPWLTVLFAACGIGAAVKVVLRVIRNVDLDKL